MPKSSDKAKASAARIVDLLQILVMTKPKMVFTLEALAKGLVHQSDDDHENGD